MYEQFYGLSRPPFANVPDPDGLFLSPQHRQALSVLQYALMVRAGFCVITGDVGTGKTTLVRELLRSRDPSIEVGLVSNTKCDSFEEFLRWILLAFDLDYRGMDKVEMYDTFVSFLVQQHERNEPVTLIIDEAQHLDAENLEQLRMLSNVNTERGQILQTILIGQPELWDLLRRPELSQFAQRISYDYYLAPLETAASTGEYIQNRLRCADGSEDLFEPQTFKQIWEATRGVPRLINLVCDTALVYGYAEESERIGRDIIAKVLNDKEIGFSPVGHRRRDFEPSPIEMPRQAAVTRTPKISTVERAAGRRRKNK